MQELTASLTDMRPNISSLYQITRAPQPLKVKISQLELRLKGIQNTD